MSDSTKRTADSCMHYAGPSGEGGYIQCGRGVREIKTFTSICEGSCPYYKPKKPKV